MIKGLASRFATGVFRRLPADGKQYCADLVSESFEEITYRRLRDAGFHPTGIIDVGAFDGNWTRLSQAIFGSVPAVMVEAQPGKANKLAAVTSQHQNVTAVMSPLSATAGEEITFYEMGTGSSLLPERSNVDRVERQLVTRTLDDVADEHLPGLSGLFLKIDVQGAELKVLAGGAKTLARSEAVQLECAMLPYNEGAPLMPEVVSYMEQRDFLPLEVSGFSRPGKALIQIDILFARTGSELRPDRFVF